MKILTVYTIKHWIAILILLLLPLLAAAQTQHGQAYLDSLLQELPGMKEDSNEGTVIKQDRKGIPEHQSGRRVKYAAKELVLAKKMGWAGAEAQAYNISGVNHLNMGSYPAALEDFFKAQPIFESVSDTENTGLVYGNIGNVFMNLKDYNKAQQYNFKQLQVAKWQNDSLQIAYSFNNIANNFSLQNKLGEALSYYKMSLDVAERLKEASLVMTNVTNIGSTYSGLKQYNLALVYNFRSLRIAEIAGNKQFLANATGNIGEAYYSVAHDTLSIKPDSLVPSTREANLSLGIEYLKKSISLSYEAKMFDAVPEFSKYLSDAYFLKGDYKSAFEAYKQYTLSKDSVFGMENNEKIANLETKRALDLKDKDIKIANLEVAKKRSERVYYISGIVLLMLIVVILFRSYKRQEQSNSIISLEKKRSDDLLLNMLPDEVAEELKSTGMAHARQFDHVSVIFTDFVDFTKLAEHLNPQELVRVLHESFSAFDAIIERNGLEKIKTIGDAYLAICGLPKEDPRHAQNCVRAAIEILSFMKERNTTGNPLQVRIGINSGAVVAGIVGVKKFAYDVWGDTVNTAARMEQHGVPGHINISNTTYQLVKDEFNCQYRGMIAAKNKGEIDMYFVNAV